MGLVVVAFPLRPLYDFCKEALSLNGSLCDGYGLKIELKARPTGRDGFSFWEVALPPAPNSAFWKRRGAATAPFVCSVTLSLTFFGHFVADVIAGQQYAEIGSVSLALPTTAAATATPTSADHCHFFAFIITRIFIGPSFVALITR